MEDIVKKFKIGYYADLILRHRWIIIILLFVFMVSGICLAIISPKIYMAQTFIKVVPKSIPTKYVPEVSELDIRERIASITQEIKSRTNIEKIIEKHELFKDPKFNKMYIEDKISAVRRNISVNVKKTRSGINSFTISFTGENPEQVMNIVNDLANSFIDASLEVMGKEVLETKNFLEGVLEEKKKNLNEVKKIINTFRKEHKGELPEQLAASLETLSRLQENQIAKQESLRDARYNLIQLEKDMAKIRKELNQLEKELAELQEKLNQIPEQEEEPVENTVEQESQNMITLKQLKEQYAALMSRYTDRHPEIIRLKNIIGDFEIKVAEELKQKTEIKKPDPPEAKTNLSVAELLQMKQLEKQIADLKKQHEDMEKQRGYLLRNIRIDEKDISDINKQILVYEKRVENTPKRELELLSLERDFAPIQESYVSLLSKKEDAMIAVNMEKRQKGQKFQIVDKAKRPQKPVSPDLKRYFLLFFAAGLGVGGGLTFLLDVLDTSMRRPEDVETLFDIPMLITIPKLYYKRDIKIKKIKSVISIFALAATLMVTAGFGVLAMKGVDRTMAYVPSKVITLVKKMVNLPK